MTFDDLFLPSQSTSSMHSFAHLSPSDFVLLSLGILGKTSLLSTLFLMHRCYPFTPTFFSFSPSAYFSLIMFTPFVNVPTFFIFSVFLIFLCFPYSISPIHQVFSQGALFAPAVALSPGKTLMPSVMLSASFPHCKPNSWPRHPIFMNIGPYGMPGMDLWDDCEGVVVRRLTFADLLNMVFFFFPIPFRLVCFVASCLLLLFFVWCVVCCSCNFHVCTRVAACC